MVINTVSTLALYCSRCGKIEVHEISHFTLQRSIGRRFICSCGQIQAVASSAASHQYLFSIPCVICETTHLISIDKQLLGQEGMNKLYCPQENIELGFVGERKVVEQTITADLDEIDRLITDMENDDFVQNPQIMFEIINKVHDIAEKGRLYCHCGRSAIEADILPDCIELKCTYCGGRTIIPAQTEQDRTRCNDFEVIEIPRGRKQRRKH